jgi:hypothetical protein
MLAHCFHSLKKLNRRYTSHQLTLSIMHLKRIKANSWSNHFEFCCSLSFEARGANLKISARKTFELARREEGGESEVIKPIKKR